MSRSWLSLMRSEESGIAPAPCSSAALASTRSSACLSSRVCLVGSDDFSSAMPNYICLNPSEYDVQLAGESVANRIGQAECRDESGLRVGTRGAVDRPQIVAH